MRCTNCRSYIPEGLSIAPITCPACGSSFDEKTSSISVESHNDDDKTPLLQTPIKPRTGEAFAPFFTIKTRLAFGVADISLAPTMGSLSFGPDGFSIVWDHGTKWERIFYKDLGLPRQSDEIVFFDLRHHESKITFYHPRLPAWFKAPRRKRAQAFIELLSHVKEGLSTVEVSRYTDFFR